MSKRIVLIALVVAVGAFMVSSQSYAQDPSTTTVTDTKTVTTPVVKKAAAKEVTTETTVVTTPAAPRPAYDQAALKKMNDTLCVRGFDAKVGNDNKNVCSGKATAPDIVYTCLWMGKGESAYPATPQGPCRLDNSEHKGDVVITKADYKSSPPLPYGTKVECCFRAAKGPATTSSSSSTVVTPVKK